MKNSFLLTFFSCAFFAACKNSGTTIPTVPNPWPLSFTVGQHDYGCSNTGSGFEGPFSMLNDGRIKFRVTVTGVNFTPQFNQSTLFFYDPTIFGINKKITSSNGTLQPASIPYSISSFSSTEDCIKIARPQTPDSWSVGSLTSAKGETEFNLKMWLIEGQPGSPCAQSNGQCKRWFFLQKFPNDPQLPQNCSNSSAIATLFVAAEDPDGFTGSCN
jgi:hypothetical protein